MRVAGCGALLCLAATSVARAQQPPARDTTRPPSGALGPDTSRPAPGAPRADSTRRATVALGDSLNPDSLEPRLPPLGPPRGPTPVQGRIVFDDDALRSSGVLSLGELLARIPGVTLVRSGWFGDPEAVAYAGQGAAAVEVYRDGFAVDPLGLDSAGLDLGRFDLGGFRRVEVEVLPSVLRVYLITEVSQARHARTEASFATGDASTNSYRLRYLNRWAGGAGIGLGATAFSTSGPATSKAGVSQLNLFARGTWAPTDRLGVEYQVNTFSYQHDPLQPSAPGATSAPFAAANVRRTDMFVRAFGSTGRDGMGLRFDALVGSSSYSDTSRALDTAIAQAALDLGYRGARWSAESWARARDGRVPLELGGRLAVSPLRPLTLAAWARSRTRLGGTATTEADLLGQLTPLSWLTLYGSGRWRRLADSADALSDTVQHTRDWTGGTRLELGWLSLDLSAGRHDAFSAHPFGAFAAQLPGVLAAGARVLTVSYEIRPWRFLTLSGWWRDPSNDSVPFEPRNHAVSRATFRSAFLPHFRRGEFDLVAQVEIESWGRGVAGRDPSGNLVRLAGQTVWNYHLQFRLVGAVLFWTMRNAVFARYTLVPGYELPRSISRFGVRWEFTN